MSIKKKNPKHASAFLNTLNILQLSGWIRFCLGWMHSQKLISLSHILPSLQSEGTLNTITSAPGPEERASTTNGARMGTGAGSTVLLLWSLHGAGSLKTTRPTGKNVSNFHFLPVWIRLKKTSRKQCFKLFLISVNWCSFLTFRYCYQ